MKTILAAIDFSPISGAVLEAATDLARAMRGRVFLLNVVQAPMMATDMAPLVSDLTEFTVEMERGARRRLQKMQTRLAADGIPTKAVCVQGVASSTILAQAKKLGADFIVLGSHGHSAFYDLVAGSTASGVLKRATCCVVIVPATPKKTPRRRKDRA